MEWSAIQEAFQQWGRNLTRESDSSLAVIRSIPSEHDGVRVALVFFSGVPHPERKVHQRVRQEQENRPVAQLRYVAAVSAPEPERAEKLLMHLMTCVDGEPAMQILTDPVPPAWWQAHGAKPMPAFQFEVCVSETQTADNAPLVQEHDIKLNVTSRSPSE
ncbi:hypothetical protein [Marinimicrobium locisalis]|uniref:hypothetical protein n=1 Tax=Marinimicrobium locisalis TaxID=546022 RepID=UPI003221485F